MKNNINVIFVNNNFQIAQALKKIRLEKICGRISKGI